MRSDWVEAALMCSRRRGDRRRGDQEHEDDEEHDEEEQEQEDEDEEEEEEEEEAPTCLNTNNCSHFLVISTDKLSAKYTGDAKHGYDVGSIQANRPAPSQRLVYYFEMYVINAGTRGKVSIGFSDQNFKQGRQPGWEPNSFGYHGDDGKLYHGPKTGEAFGPTFTTGDTVGAGINYAAQAIFFTKNNKLVGATYKDVKHALYPTIGLHSADERVSVNFGLAPFVFDVEALVQEERERRQRDVDNVHLPLDVSHSVVRSYLLHYGYQDTLTAFDNACGGTYPGVFKPGYEDYAIDQRKVLRRLAREGDVDGVFAKLHAWYPKLLQDDKSAVVFLLHCQKFIELVKDGSVEAAVAYAQAELARYFGIEPFHVLLQDCFGLLAYEMPATSPVGYLFLLRQRDAVADAINAVVMATNPAVQSPSPQSSLEKLLRQLSACQSEIRLLNGGQGEVFRLDKVLPRPHPTQPRHQPQQQQQLQQQQQQQQQQHRCQPEQEHQPQQQEHQPHQQEHQPHQQGHQPEHQQQLQQQQQQQQHRPQQQQHQQQQQQQV